MKKQSLFTVLNVILLLSFSSISLQGQKSADLKYNLNQGDTYSYIINIDQDVVFEANGQTMALDVQMTFESSTLVDGVTADSINLESTIDRVKMTQGIFGMQVTYDSDDPATAQNPMAAQIAQSMGMVVGKSYTQVMDLKGNVIRMDMGNLTENDDLANNLNSGAQFGLYPDYKVKVGDSWEKDIAPVKESDMKVHAKYTLTKLSGKTATIQFDGIISANTMQDMDMKMDGTQKGEMIVDVNTGWLIESTINQDIELDVEQNGQKFPATISGTINTTSAKK
jgi:hypothetical protein